MQDWPVEIQMLALIIYGASFGSFLTVLTTRTPIFKRSNDRLSKNIVKSSACPYCLTDIKFYHNIPIISFIALKGKCKHCNHTIPLRYFMTELAMGLSGVLGLIISNSMMTAIIIMSIIFILLYFVNSWIQAK